MTAELVVKLGSVETRGERPCVPPAGMVELLQAMRGQRAGTVWSKIKQWLGRRP
jgi:hypothetical protein